jgi:hypothetical protein
MAGFSDSSENSILNLIYSATAWANVADNTVSTPLTNISVALHTADPGDAGAMNTSEVAYTSYARVNVARSTGWTTASTGVISPAAQIDFPAGTGGSGTVTHFSTGKTTGAPASIIFMSGTVTPSIVTGSAVTPHLTVATTLSLD